MFQILRRGNISVAVFDRFSVIRSLRGTDGQNFDGARAFDMKVGRTAVQCEIFVDGANALFAVFRIGYEQIGCLCVQRARAFHRQNNVAFRRVCAARIGHGERRSVLGNRGRKQGRFRLYVIIVTDQHVVCVDRAEGDRRQRKRENEQYY